MKKRVLILGGLEADHSPQTEYAGQFAHLMPDYEFTEVRFDHLAFYISGDRFSVTNSHSKEELSAFDLVVFRGKIRRSSPLAYVVSRYCSVTGTPFFNDYSNYRPSSKLAQAVLFYEEKVPFIETCYSSNPEILKQQISREFTYPIILKDNYGSHGFDNYLVANEAEFDDITARNPDIQFIAQRYYANSGDYRVLVAGDLPPLQIWRQAADSSHLNNTSQGGEASLTDDLPGEIIAEAQRLAAKLKMSIAGVDLIKSSETGELYFLEVNSQPQLLTGAFLDEKAAMLQNFFGRRLNS
jgi:glutathione synthase/RimK-type ligase-like ATP-grasp enzyme